MTATVSIYIYLKLLIYVIFTDMAGNQHYALAQLDEAYAHYNKALDLDPQGQYFFNRGLV